MPVLQSCGANLLILCPINGLKSFKDIAFARILKICQYVMH